MKETSLQPWMIILALAGYVAIFLAMRLTNLLALPVFGDEVLHITWVRATLAGDYLIALREGLRPIYIWLVAVVTQFWPDILLSGRIVSVLAGLITAIICYKLTNLLYPQRRLGFLAAVFYVLCPFTLFYDRLGLVDTLLIMFSGFSFVLSIKLWRQPSIITALILGFVFALATLTKINAVLYYSVPILLWIFWGNILNWRKTIVLLGFVYMVPLLTWIPIIRQEMYNVFLNQFTVINPAQPSSDLQFWERGTQNLLSATEWLTGYLTFPFILLLAFGILMILIKRDRSGFILVGLVLSIILFYVAIFNHWYPRYLLPAIIPISVIVARAVDYLTQFISTLAQKWGYNLSSSHRLVLGGIFLVFSIPALFFDYLLITEPPAAPLPAIEQWQYVQGPYSGYGLPESAAEINRLARQHPQTTFLTGLHTLDSLGASFYLQPSENITVETLANFDQNLPAHLDALAQKGPVLTVSTVDVAQDDAFISFGKINCYQVERIDSFPKPGHKVKVNIYQWMPEQSYCSY